jgi:hypothetical protein
MKTHINKLLLSLFFASLLVIANTNDLLAQDNSRETRKVSLEELYAAPNHQDAWLKTSNGAHDTFFCNPGNLDDLSLNYFCYALKKSNRNIMQVKRNAQTSVLTLVCTPKSITEAELHDTVGKLRKEIAHILSTEPNPYGFMEDKAID